jgi:purine-nucleoside phosphorylase
MTFEQINDAVEFLSRKGIKNPEVGIILGTGLSNVFPTTISDRIVINYADIPHFPLSTVETHNGKLIYGKLQGKQVIAMQGRLHYYEGYRMDQITFPVRVLKVLGIRHLLISNASGKLNPTWKKGELMLITDHINLQPDNPLRGKNLDQLGPRFPDMSSPYCTKLNSVLRTVAAAEKIVLNEGVYAAVPGPNLETRAEYRYLKIIGADAVGMSTVPEVIVANHMKLPCAAISVLTDDCDPENLKPVSLAEIIAIAEKAEPGLTRIFAEAIATLV